MQDKGDFIGKFKNFQYQLKLKRCQTDALLDNAFVTRVAHQGKTHLSENTAAGNDTTSSNGTTEVS